MFCTFKLDVFSSPSICLLLLLLFCRTKFRCRSFSSFCHLHKYSLPHKGQVNWKPEKRGGGRKAEFWASEEPAPCRAMALSRLLAVLCLDAINSTWWCQITCGVFTLMIEGAASSGASYTAWLTSQGAPSSCLHGALIRSHDTVVFEVEMLSPRWVLSWFLGGIQKSIPSYHVSKHVVDFQHLPPS